MTWKKEHLKALVDKRIGVLFREAYTSNSVRFDDIFPNKVKEELNSFDFMVQRTLMRPRDIIAFVANDNNILRVGDLASFLKKQR